MGMDPRNQSRPRHFNPRLLRTSEFNLKRKLSSLMVRRRARAVSNHEAPVADLHPSRRGEDAAPQDEGPGRNRKR
jgi:hypothetical protein